MNLISTNFRLSFNEANILVENIVGLDKTNLIIRLKELSETAPDAVLKRSATNMYQKLGRLSETEYGLLQGDAAAGLVLYPPGYMFEN